MNLPDDIPSEFLIEEAYRPAAGPGGQHVNRTASGIRLYFRFRECPLLSDDWKERLALAAASCLENDRIVIKSHDSRSFHQNREAAYRRLEVLLSSTGKAPKKRRVTKPTKASVERRLSSKSRHSAVKKDRRRVISD